VEGYRATRRMVFIK